MKFRLYRQLSLIQYKDIEAKNKEEAYKFNNAPREEFKTTDGGYITNVWIDTDLTKEKRLGELKIMEEDSENVSQRERELHLWYL